MQDKSNSGIGKGVIALGIGFIMLPIVAIIGIIFFLLVFFVTDDDENNASACSYSISVGSEEGEGLGIDIAERVSQGVFAGMEGTFYSLAEEYQIDPILFMAIAYHETGWGTSNAVVNYNNPGGLMNPATGSRQLYRFSTLEEGMEAMARTLHNRIVRDGLNTIEKLGAVYAPIGAANDPTNLNSHWVPNITKFYQALGGSITCDSPMMAGEFANPTGHQFRVTSRYGWRDIGFGPEHHDGIDLACATGDPIYAVQGGTVSRSTFMAGGYGNYVYIEHENGMRTVYAHLTQRMTDVGDVVNAGQQIGTCGNTGRSFGSHLHFEVQLNGTRVDPYPYISIYDQ